MVVEKIKENQKLKVFLFFWSLFIASSSFAGMEDFQKDLNFANSIRSTVQEKGATFKPEEIFKNYTPHPEQGKYYGGVTQSSDIAMQKDAQTGSSLEPAAKGVKDDFKTRPIYTVNQDSQEIKKSRIIEKDSYDISHGISDKYVDCTKASTCKKVNVEKTCNEETRFLQKSCFKTPEVTVTEVPYQETESFSGVIAPTDNYSGSFILPVAGTVTSFNIVLKSGNVWRCSGQYSSYLQTTLIGNYHGSCGDELGDLSFSNSQMQVPILANTPIKFSIAGFSSGKWSSASYNLTMQVTKYRKEAHISWQEVCKNV